MARDDPAQSCREIRPGLPDADDDLILELAMAAGCQYKIIPLVLTKEAGAAIGIVSCLGALGGFVPPLLLGWTMDHLGSPAWAYTGMALFALLCLLVNVWFYHRRTSPTHC